MTYNISVILLTQLKLNHMSEIILLQQILDELYTKSGITPSNDRELKIFLYFVETDALKNKEKAEEYVSTYTGIVDRNENEVTILTAERNTRSDLADLSVYNERLEAFNQDTQVWQKLIYQKNQNILVYKQLLEQVGIKKQMLT